VSSYATLEQGDVELCDTYGVGCESDSDLGALGEPRAHTSTNRVTVAAARGPRSVACALDALAAEGVDVDDVGLRRPTLDVLWQPREGNGLRSFRRCWVITPEKGPLSLRRQPWLAPPRVPSYEFVRPARAPRAWAVSLDRGRGVEQRLDDPPCLFNAVLSCEQAGVSPDGVA
jgi:hypothetical protein